MSDSEFQKELITIMKNIESKLDVISKDITEFKNNSMIKPPSLFDLFNPRKGNNNYEDEDEDEDDEDEDDEDDEDEDGEDGSAEAGAAMKNK